MSVLDALDIGTHITFDLYPSAIIGTTFTNVEVLAILDFSTAMLFEDVGAMHANVYPTLPSGTVNDPKKYLYAKLLMENGNIQIVGIPWIKEDTILTTSTQNMTITINSVNPVQQAAVKQILAANGFTVTATVLS